MTVLVTGGAGYIGSHMVYALFAAGERVIVLDNLSTGFDWAVAAGVPLVVGETGDQNLVSTIIKEPRSSPSFILQPRLWYPTRSPTRSATTKTTRSTLAR
jgi:UDP-glucose 4-epimerase